MIQVKYVLLIIFVALALVWACKPAPNASSASVGIAEALADNNPDSARKQADALFAGSFKPDEASVTDLCALAVALVRLSESGVDNNDYTARALQCYRAAIQRDSVAAHAYFEQLSAGDYGYVHLLNALRRQVDARESGQIITEEPIDHEEQQ